MVEMIAVTYTLNLRPWEKDRSVRVFFLFNFISYRYTIQVIFSVNTFVLLLKWLF